MADVYDHIHEPLAMTLCLFGIAGHCFSIGILSKMLNPTNLLLISMSCTVYKFGSEELCISRLWSYAWTCTLLVSVNASVIVHMCGVFHVVALSIVRYVSLRQLSQATANVQWFTTEKCVRTLVLIYGSVLVVCGPLYFHAHVVEAEQPDELCLARQPHAANATAFHLELADSAQLQQLNFWLFGSIGKLVPCSVLLVMSFLILSQLKQLRSLSARFKSVERDRQYNRTTNMILMIMVVFIAVEFPQGVMAVAQSLTSEPYQTVWGDLFETLTLLTSCVIFGLFFTMNSSLRDAFLDAMARIFPKFCISSLVSDIKTCCSQSPDTDIAPEAERLVQPSSATTYGNTDV